MPTVNPYGNPMGPIWPPAAEGPDLSASQPFGSFGSMPAGGKSPGAGGGGSSGSSIDYGGVAGAVAPLIFSLFGNNPAKGKAGRSADDLSKMAASFGSGGKGLTETGNAALAPVLKYLQAIVGGNTADIMGAAAPERARIIDQYDTARKSIGTFSPRGGGTSAVINESRVREASDLATTTASIRTKAVDQLSQLGMGFEQLGAQKESQSLAAGSEAQKAYQTQSNEQDKQLAGMGAAIGTALPFILAAFSSRELKDSIESIDPEDVHQALRKLKISKWSYKTNPEMRHMGPMAEDFLEAFGVGDGKTIHLVDVMGVLLASQKALALRLEAT